MAGHRLAIATPLRPGEHGEAPSVARAWHARLDPHYAALAVVEEPADFRLSEEEIERFVAEGVLWVRGCFTRAAADALLRATLDERTPAPRLGRRPGETSDLDPATLDLRDPRTWQGHVRVEPSRSPGRHGREHRHFARSCPAPSRAEVAAR